MAMAMHNDNEAHMNDRSKDQNQEYSLIPRTSSETAAPIAKVLNTDAPVPYISQPSNAAHNFSTTPFSGRLVDLLLDTPESPAVREKFDYLSAEVRPAESTHSVIQLPKLPQLAAKKTQRPRIPPLLQGLHQPPPLPPSNRLFPPITSDKSVFSNGSRDRGSFDSRSGTNLSPVKSGSAISTSTAASNNDDSRGESGLQESRAVNNNPNTGEPDVLENTTSSKDKVLDDVQSKPGRRRRRWSEQETKDLLVGVSRYGIGSWKKILQSPDFNFHGRTAVDLKDRFRVCCPSETSKTGKPNQRKPVAELPSHLSPKALAPLSEVDGHNHRVSNGNALSQPEAEPAKKQKASHSTLVASQMADIGISGPFVRRSRRPQCKFSSLDDSNLLKGFEKYGSVWRAICDDAELGFGTRRPTDLRDRFRIKFPEKFAKSGHKVKAKHDKIISEQQAANKEREQQTQLHQTEDATPPQSAKRNSWYSSEMERLAKPSESLPDMTFLSPPNPTSKSNDNTPYTFNPFPAMFEDYGSLEHDEFSNSPIILNRDILQWADANHTSSYNQVMTHGTADQTSRSSNPIDGNHFNNTWAGFQARSTDLSITSFPSTSSRPSLPNELPSHSRSTSLIMTATHTNTIANANASPNNLVPNSTAKNNDMLKTPNLPYIVFPYVPAASARNTLHNLPTPADLLSGVEDDALGSMMESFQR